MIDFLCGYSGVVSISSRVDFETVESSQFTAQVWDSGTPRLSNTTTVYITIRNINDNSPIFAQVTSTIPSSYTCYMSQWYVIFVIDCFHYLFHDKNYTVLEKKMDLCLQDVSLYYA